jgi:hypothetical protein
LSRLPRTPPKHVSPALEEEKAIEMAGDLAQTQEQWFDRIPAERAMFMAWTLDDALQDRKSGFAITRSQGRNAANEKLDIPSDNVSTDVPLPVETGGGIDRAGISPVPIWSNVRTKEPVLNVPESMQDSASVHIDEELDTLQPTLEYWGATNPPPNIHVGMEKVFKDSWIAAYKKDAEFKTIWKSATATKDEWKPGQRFFRSDEGLLFFRDADYQPRLCVPYSKMPEVLAEAHETAMGAAHTSPERLWTKLSSKFYWKHMKKDIDEFCDSCDICQKIKHRNFTRYGYLTPNPIPSRPYESISLDLIVNLLWSGDYNAILVVVDRLTKHATFIPTTSGLSAQGFAELFVSHIVSCFGILDSIIADRDPRWTSDFWTAVAAAIKTKMSLSSSHHPQHDGQTENVNRQLETMLRTFVSKDKADWADWLKLLEFSYNNNVHASIGTTPFLLLYGFELKAPLDFLLPGEKGAPETYGMKKETSVYLEQLRIRRENARLSIAKAQDEQARYFNRRRREIPEFKVGSKVLINPHSLEWIESKGEGAKLVQRWIGPFEVLQRINPRTYRLHLNNKYPGFPIFNLDHLKLYKETLNEFGKRLVMLDTREHRLDAEEYEVEKIVGKKYNKRRKQYTWLVRWKNYGPQFDTWQTRKDLRNAPEMLRAFAKESPIV